VKVIGTALGKKAAKGLVLARFHHALLRRCLRPVGGSPTLPSPWPADDVLADLPYELMKEEQ
jgi:hypothetical protein